MENIDFADWLKLELDKRDWSQADLARLSKISPTQIARILSRERNIGTDSITAIAHAFNISPIVIYRKAGLLPENNGADVKLDDWEFLLKQMSPEDEAELRQIAEMKIERRKKEQSLKTLKPKRAG